MKIKIRKRIKSKIKIKIKISTAHRRLRFRSLFGDKKRNVRVTELFQPQWHKSALGGSNILPLRKR
jgi:hypothetical protein